MDFVVEGDRSRGRPKRKLGKTVDGEFEKFEDKKENMLCEDVRHSKNTTPKLEQSRPIFLSLRLTAIDRLSNF